MRKSDLENLRIETNRTVVRSMLAEDFAEILSWPKFPFPYESYDMVKAEGPTEGGKYWWQLIDAADRMHFSVVERTTGDIIGVHVLVRVDWEASRVGNMGIRVRADMCDLGYGAESLKALLRSLLGIGMRSIRLDVTATNKRAIRCYEKCGMRVTGQTWLACRGPAIEPDDPSWATALQHLKRKGDKWLARVYWMEIAAT